LADPCVISEIAVRHERPDAQASGLRFLDFGKRQAGDVDQPSRLCDILFQKVDEVGAAGDEFGVGISGDLTDGVPYVARLDVIESDHGADSGGASCMTSSMAATIFG